MEKCMNTDKQQFTIEGNVLDGTPFEVLGKNKESRYHSSYSVWQLARMGAYNEAEALPLLLRLDAFGEVAELYQTHERYVTMMDIAETDTAENQLLSDLLLGFAIRYAHSNDSSRLQFLIVSSAKSMESVPYKMDEWKEASEIQSALAKKLDALNSSGKTLPDGLSADLLAAKVMSKVRIEYQRRRHGRLGDETLWGRELETIRVFQDAGIEGSDIARALKFMTRIASNHVEPSGAATGRLFDRKAARLLIRDFQRRARVSMPYVRVIDEHFLAEENARTGNLPRIPAWNQAKDESSMHLIKRDIFDQALRWARRAAATSGRGLLPVFFLTGPSGSGKSVLLKQIALALYHQGYAVAEILDIFKAAERADNLATAAVALDSPLILIWDNALGLDNDPPAAIKEIAAAQISGVPILILGAAPDAGYPANP
jgi:hypothetical protein